MKNRFVLTVFLQGTSIGIATSLSPKQKRRAIETLVQLLAKPQEPDQTIERLTMAHDDPARCGLVADLDEDEKLIFLSMSLSEEQMATSRQQMRELLVVHLRKHPRGEV